MLLTISGLIPRAIPCTIFAVVSVGEKKTNLAEEISILFFLLAVHAKNHYAMHDTKIKLELHNGGAKLP